MLFVKTTIIGFLLCRKLENLGTLNSSDPAEIRVSDENSSGCWVLSSWALKISPRVEITQRLCPPGTALNQFCGENAFSLYGAGIYCVASCAHYSSAFLCFPFNLNSDNKQL